MSCDNAEDFFASGLTELDFSRPSEAFADIARKPKRSKPYDVGTAPVASSAVFSLVVKEVARKRVKPVDLDAFAKELVSLMSLSLASGISFE